MKNFTNLFIRNDLFEFINIERNRYYKQNSDKKKQYKKSIIFFDIAASEIKK